MEVRVQNYSSILWKAGLIYKCKLDVVSIMSVFLLWYHHLDFSDHCVQFVVHQLGAYGCHVRRQHVSSSNNVVHLKRKARNVS